MKEKLALACALFAVPALLIASTLPDRLIKAPAKPFPQPPKPIIWRGVR
jgi:hypothetical protein